MSLITDTCTELHDLYPGIHFNLYSGNSEDVTDRLDRGLLDFGILIQPADLSRYDSLRIPAAETWGVLMRKDSPLASQKGITKDDLLDLPLIFSRQVLQSGTSGNPYFECSAATTEN